MTNRYTGGLTILDDDPRPTVEIVTPRRRVHEGEAAVWRVRLSRATDYFVSVHARFVLGNHTMPRLRVADVRERWIQRYIGEPPASRPLHRIRHDFQVFLEPGQRAVSVEMPIRHDGRAEGNEVATLRVSALRTSDRAPVFVVPR